MAGKIQHVKEQDKFDKLLALNELVMVKFTAAWCGPCQVIAPVYERLSEATNNVKFLEVDVDQSQAIAAKHKVTSMPTFVSFHKKKEHKRLSGANPQALAGAVKELSDLNPSATVSNGAGDASSAAALSDSSALGPEVKKYVTKGYELLNDTIMTSSSDVLNVLQVKEDQTATLFDITKAPVTENYPTVVSDADSQILIYAPFMNKTKAYSILIKASADSKTPDGDDTQRPSKIKVWANTTGTIAFEDAASGDGCLHEADIPESSYDENGWAEIQLRFVRFQNVGSLLIFIDGEDEDESTSIQKVAIVGSKGESLASQVVQKIDMD